MDRSVVLDELATRISHIKLAHPVRVGIDGVDAAGKTTLVDELVPYIRSTNREVIRASIDGFHNPARVRHARGKLSAEGYYLDSFNYDALLTFLLDPLGPAGTLRYTPGVFDYRSDREIHHQLISAAPDAVLLFDGVFLLRPELERHWDFSVFVDASFEVTLKRARERDLNLFGSEDDVLRQYEQRYIPGQKMYFLECQPKERASMIIDNNDANNPLIVNRSHQSNPR
jgi:uridine kinase